MNLSILLITLLVVVVGLVVSFLTEEDRKKRWWITSAAVLACIGAIFQYGKSVLDSIANDKELLTEKKRYETLVDKNDEQISKHEQLLEINKDLVKKHDTLQKTNNTLQSKVDDLSPFISLVMEKYGKADKEAIQKLAIEIDKIMNPTLVFLSDRTKQKTLDDKGQVETDYYFRSKYPMVIRDARVDLRFDTQLISVQGGTRNMLPYSNNSRIGMHPDRKGVTITANHLGEAGQLRIAVFTKVPPKLIKYQMSP